ncbi:MAG: DUF1385 domain-containing protein [Chloroflexota bacterium]
MSSDKKRGFPYGGQAVLEGIMMRGRRWAIVAVRTPSSEIVLHSERLPRALYEGWFIKVPFVRGVAMLWDTLVLGMRALMYSANVALEEEEAEFSKPMMWGTVAVAILFAIGLFFVTPLLLVGLADRYIESSFTSNLIEGAIRLLVFLAYLWAIGWMPDIQRVFAYHGAEHKCINAHEAGKPLEPSNAASFTTAHPRCGTSFLLVVMAISILIFALLGRPPMEWRILSRIVLIPVIAGVAYEFIKFTALHYSHPLVRWMAAPGLALQRLTTREPDESMLEVGMVALREVMRLDAMEESEEVSLPVAEVEASSVS